MFSAEGYAVIGEVAAILPQGPVDDVVGINSGGVADYTLVIVTVEYGLFESLPVHSSNIHTF